ncbi:MAG: hypothetical protein GXP42_19930 [Chloroflexi bacterium]|nr:hypothetical protein [Chloroflexota bacterium]
MLLILAPANGGKTTYVLEQARAVQRKRPFARVWIIAAGREQTAALRRRLVASGPSWGVEILTFHELYVRILARGGRPVPLLPDPARHRLLRAVIDHLAERGRLEHFAALRHKPGFLRRVRDLVTELQRACIRPKDFERAVADRGPGLIELAAIYAEYQARLHESGWADAETIGWLAIDALSDAPQCLQDIALLAIDGFDEFNPTQLALLRRLDRHLPRLIITLTGDPDAEPPRQAHRRFIRARRDLLAAFPNATLLPLKDDRARSRTLAVLEQALFRNEPRLGLVEGDILMTEARDRRQEARAALRWAKQLIVREGFQPDQIAILARDIHPYRPFLQETAREFGLPFIIAEGRELVVNPAIAALVRVLRLPETDWPARDLLQTWRSPYFDWSPLAAEHGFQDPETLANALETIAREHRIVRGLEPWRDALQRLAHADPDARPIQDAAALLALFEAFIRRLTPRETATLAQHIAFVEDLIGDDPLSSDSTAALRLREDLATTPRDYAALLAFKDALRGLLLAQDILAHMPGGPKEVDISYRRFLNELLGAVQAALYEPPPPEQPAIRASSVLRARGLSFRAAAVLGLAEGEFPPLEREDPFLPDHERGLLAVRGIPLPLRLRGEEPTIFYEAVTRARERLLLTRPYLTDDGQPWDASPYWREIRSLLSAPTRAPSSPPSIHTAPASPAEWLALAARQSRAPANAPPEAWSHIQRGAAILARRLARRAQGPFEGDLASLSPRLHGRYHAQRYIWSVGHLETYADCPFRFFITLALRLEPKHPVEEGYDARILGAMMHDILAAVYTAAVEVGDWSQQSLLTLLPVVAQPILDAAPDKHGFRPTPLWEHRRAEIIAALERTLAALAQHEDDYRPRAFEQSFGLEMAPPLEVRAAQGEFRLRGVIDRIDAANDDPRRLRIIDYKLSHATIRREDLHEGKRLQLPLYALAAEQALGMGRVVEAGYWGIRAAKPGALRLGPDDMAAALETAIDHALRHIRAIRSGRFHPAPPARGCPSFCPAATFCWRHKN